MANHDLRRVTLFLSNNQIAAIDRQRGGIEPRSIWIRRVVARELDRRPHAFTAKEVA